MKKLSRATGKSAMKHDTSQPDVEGDSAVPLTGMFCEDFAILCDREGLVHVPVVTHSLSSTGGGAPQLDSAAGASSDMSSQGDQPNAMPLCSRLHVTLEDEADPLSVKDVQIRNIKVTEKLVTVISGASAKCQKLCGFGLWNSGLVGGCVARAMLQLVQLRQLRHLSIEGSGVVDALFDELLGPQSLLQRVSLRCSQFTDSHCEQLAPLLEENKTLLCLHLGCNHITDTGLLHITKALRRNRTLLSLSLVGNKITDEGAGALAEVLSRFALTHEEIVSRRRHMLDRKDEERHPSARSSPSTTSLSDRSNKLVKSSTASGGAERSRGKGKPDNKKVEDKLKKEDKSKKGVSSPDPKKAARGGGKETSKGGSTVKKPPQVAEQPVSPKVEQVMAVDPVDPLLEEGEEVEGRIMLPGNMSLASLALGHNCITDHGLRLLLKALERQRQYSHRGTGLLRLTFKPNWFPVDSRTAKHLAEAMQVLDPFYKLPTATNEVTVETTENSIPPNT